MNDIKAVGQAKTHLSFKLITDDNQRISAIYFNAKESDKALDPFSKGDQIECVYQPSLNVYYGRTTLQLRLVSAKKLG